MPSWPRFLQSRASASACFTVRPRPNRAEPPFPSNCNSGDVADGVSHVIRQVARQASPARGVRLHTAVPQPTVGYRDGPQRAPPACPTAKRNQKQPGNSDQSLDFTVSSNSGSNPDASLGTTDPS